MIKYFLIFCLFLFSDQIMSQSNLLNANTPSEIGKKTQKQIELDFNEPIEHPYVDDKDVMWSKVVYEYVDGSNFPVIKVNFNIYFLKEST